MTPKTIRPMRCTCCAPRSGDATSRRRLLLGMAALAALGPLAACRQEATRQASITPAEIKDDTACELDGMLLADYPGPKGQIHYADNPEPVFFCDTVETLHTLILPEQVRTVKAAFVQDMGKTGWERPEGNWIDAQTALYVHGSRLHGSMGPTFASFSQEADAKKFIDEHGGKLMRMKEIPHELLDLRGGAHMDHSM